MLLRKTNRRTPSSAAAEARRSVPSAFVCSYRCAADSESCKTWPGPRDESPYRHPRELRATRWKARCRRSPPAPSRLAPRTRAEPPRGPCAPRTGASSKGAAPTNPFAPVTRTRSASRMGECSSGATSTAHAWQHQSIPNDKAARPKYSCTASSVARSAPSRGTQSCHRSVSDACARDPRGRARTRARPLHQGHCTRHVHGRRHGRNGSAPSSSTMSRASPPVSGAVSRTTIESDATPRSRASSA